MPGSLVEGWYVSLRGKLQGPYATEALAQQASRKATKTTMVSPPAVRFVKAGAPWNWRPGDAFTGFT